MHRLILTATSLYLSCSGHEKNSSKSVRCSYTLLYIQNTRCECIAADDLYINRVPFDRYRFRLEWENINQNEGSNERQQHRKSGEADLLQHGKMSKYKPSSTHRIHYEQCSLSILSFRCHSDLFYLLFSLAVLLSRASKSSHPKITRKNSFKHNCTERFLIESCALIKYFLTFHLICVAVAIFLLQNKRHYHLRSLYEHSIQSLQLYCIGLELTGVEPQPM